MTSGLEGFVAAELWPIILYYGINWPTPPCTTRNQFILFLFKYALSIMEFLGSASAMSQKIRWKSAFSRACMCTDAQQSSSEMSGNCGSLPSLYHLRSRSFHVPFYVWYFLQEHRGMFLSTVVTHKCIINNWCHPLMNKSSREKTINF